MKVDNNIIGFAVSLALVFVFSVIMGLTATKNAIRDTTVDSYGYYPTRNEFAANNSLNAS